MSCTRMEGKILGYVDGRLKESERLEMEKHLAACSACQLRVNEFRMVSGFLEELPEIQPSAAFDVRVRARVAAEPKKQSWWAWLAPSPRVAFAATALLAAIIWIGVEGPKPIFDNPKEADAQMLQDVQSLDDQDVISNFEPLKDLPQPVQADQTDNPGTLTNQM
jgi:anti-sigma factor RsiW